jgi:hypothetical protein
MGDKGVEGKRRAWRIGKRYLDTLRLVILLAANQRSITGDIDGNS